MGDRPKQTRRRGKEVERSPALAASGWWGERGGGWLQEKILGNEGGRAQYGISWNVTEHKGTNESRLHCKEFTTTEFRTEPGWTGQSRQTECVLGDNNMTLSLAVRDIPNKSIEFRFFF